MNFTNEFIEQNMNPGDKISFKIEKQEEAQKASKPWILKVWWNNDIFYRNSFSSKKKAIEIISKIKMAEEKI